MLDLVVCVLVYLLPFATLALGKGGGSKGSSSGKSGGSTTHPAPIVYGSGSTRRHYVTCPKNTKLDKGAIIGIAVGCSDYEPPTGGYMDDDAKHSDTTIIIPPNPDLIEKDGVDKNDKETVPASTSKS
ncbi:hypothetical protein DL96DRAFT_1563973 [Flagelloscypha sp. PMI_526]|nr:hypothetical protein DL96DRAFT_1563973 [Flagelloscypha sp. PMI_526]